jgi:regulator of sigma E protease
VTTILSFVFVLGVLIFVHELGHFMMARRIGVRVLTFSLGFGPRILSIKRGDTEYCISAIPLGGYVKMAGENPEDNRTGASDEFLSKTKWQRFQVLVMGPVMNLALALVVMAAVLYQGAPVPAFETQPVVIGAFAENSVAQSAGLQVGDRITAVDGRSMENWKNFSMAVATRANRPIVLRVERDGSVFERQMTPAAQSKYEIGDIGVLPNTHPHIRSVTSGDPAEKAGLKTGDVILAINGETVSFARQLSELISRQKGEPITVRFSRNGQDQEVQITPVKRTDELWAIGIGISDQLTHVDPGVFEAFRMSLVQNWEATGLIFRTLGGLFTGETSPKQLMGPVGIASLSGESAEAGIIPLLGLLASISLNLGLLNLLPIPVLDGGHILILLLEGIARRDFSMRVKERMLFAGFVLLMLLMVTVIYNDLTRVEWVENLMFWR